MADKCPTCGSDDYAEEVCPMCMLATMTERGIPINLFMLREAVASVRLSRVDKRENGNGTRNQSATT